VRFAGSAMGADDGGTGRAKEAAKRERTSPKGGKQAFPDRRTPCSSQEVHDFAPTGLPDVVCVAVGRGWPQRETNSALRA
jgi:hypothetical protein